MHRTANWDVQKLDQCENRKLNIFEYRCRRLQNSASYPICFRFYLIRTFHFIIPFPNMFQILPNQNFSFGITHIKYFPFCEIQSANLYDTWTLRGTVNRQRMSWEVELFTSCFPTRYPNHWTSVPQKSELSSAATDKKRHYKHDNSRRT